MHTQNENTEMLSSSVQRIILSSDTCIILVCFWHKETKTIKSLNHREKKYPSSVWAWVCSLLRLCHIFQFRTWIRYKTAIDFEYNDIFLLGFDNFSFSIRSTTVYRRIFYDGEVYLSSNDWTNIYLNCTIVSSSSLIFIQFYIYLILVPFTFHAFTSTPHTWSPPSTCILPGFVQHFSIWNVTVQNRTKKTYTLLQPFSQYGILLPLLLLLLLLPKQD